jgi:hypothetical protein
MLKSPSEVPLDLRPLPHAVGLEKSVLSSLLQEQERFFPVCAEQGITEDSFHLPGHALLFAEMERRHGQGERLELVSFIQSLMDRGALDRVGGPAELAGIYTYDTMGGAHFPRHAKLLRDKEVQRGMIRLFRNGIEEVFGEPEVTDGHLTRVSEALAGLASARPGNLTLRDRARQLFFRPEVRPEREEICLMLGDIPVAARGNITVIQGKSKVGKSAVVSAIIGAALAARSAQPGDCLAFRWQGGGDGAEPGIILHLDTEQSPGDWHGLVCRALVRAGLVGREEEAMKRLVSLPLVSFTRAERLLVLQDLLEGFRKQGRTVDLIVIDGIADLCISPNDEAEGLELVSRILSLAHEYRTAIKTIIHENPTTDAAKTRGHLGSELNRKAFANLRIDKDTSTGISVIYGTDMRKRDIPLSHGFCFGWDDRAGMHVHKGRNAAMKAEERERVAAAEARDYWGDLYAWADEAGVLNRNDGCFPVLSIKHAREVDQRMNRKAKMIAEDTMRKRMQRAEVLSVLRKTGHGEYELLPNRKTGNESESE